jgi:hypothetical protein
MRTSLTFLLLIIDATDHKKYVREDGKIEAQNKKVRATQQAMIKHQERVDQIASSHPLSMETLQKATKTLEKSKKDFRKGSRGWNGIDWNGFR